MPEAASPARLPSWLRVRPASGENYERLKLSSRARGLNTVCEEARCPNLAECWGGGTATFMLLGGSCTRACRFCSVSTAARPAAPDPEEPRALAETLAEMKLEYAVLTTVCRDDLSDQGAGHVAACVRAVKERCPDLLVEVLLPDFRGDFAALATVAGSGPDVLAHNLETVERLSPSVRDSRASYRQSLAVLAEARRIGGGRKIKSSLMLGLGETDSEIRACLEDLRTAGVDIVTLGQYLRPTGAPRHLPVSRFVSPEEFARHGDAARELGFLFVASGAFVRSSYRAGELFMKGLLKEKKWD
mgnify:CR=1 FL=1